MKFKTILGAAVALGTIALASVTAHAATFRVGAESLTGDSVTLPITAEASADNVNSLNGYIIELKYDGTLVDVVSHDDTTTNETLYATQGTGLTGGVFVSGRTSGANTKEEVLAVAWANSSAVDLSAEPANIANVEFTLDAGVDKDKIQSIPVYITVKQFAPNATTLKSDYQSDVLYAGSIDLASILYGDANSDKVVTSSDATAILKYKAGKLVLTEVELKAADVNSDGVVTSSDATTILKYKAGKIDSLPTTTE
jgi:hypothetical protein